MCEEKREWPNFLWSLLIWSASESLFFVTLARVQELRTSLCQNCKMMRWEHSDRPSLTYKMWKMLNIHWTICVYILLDVMPYRTKLCTTQHTDSFNSLLLSIRRSVLEPQLHKYFSRLRIRTLMSSVLIHTSNEIFSKPTWIRRHTIYIVFCVSVDVIQSECNGTKRDPEKRGCSRWKYSGNNYKLRHHVNGINSLAHGQKLAQPKHSKHSCACYTWSMNCESP